MPEEPTFVWLDDFCGRPAGGAKHTVLGKLEPEKKLSLLLFIGHKEAGEGAHLNRVNVAPPLNHTGGVLRVQSRFFNRIYEFITKNSFPLQVHNSAYV